MRPILFYIAAITFIFSGCETIVEVDIPESAPSLTVNAPFSPDSVFKIKVSSSQHILANTTFQPVTEAAVILFENEITYDTLVYQNDGIYVSPTGKKPSKEKTYAVKIQANGFNTVEAQSAIPAEPVVNEVQVFHGEGYSKDSEKYHHYINLMLKDPASPGNYYEFTVFAETKRVDLRTNEIITEFIPARVFTEKALGEDHVLFDDTSFNGKDILVRINIEKKFEENTRFFLHVKALSYDLYKYYLTHDLQYELSEDPFAQPFNVHSNVRQGFGIFGGYAEMVYITQ
jgi:hypothetical protein